MLVGDIGVAVGVGVSVIVEVDVSNVGVPVSADVGVWVEVGVSADGIIMVNVGVFVEMGTTGGLKMKLPNIYNKTMEINTPVPIPPHKSQFRLGVFQALGTGATCAGRGIGLEGDVFSRGGVEGGGTLRACGGAAFVVFVAS